MSIWSRITEAMKSLAVGEGLAALFDRLWAPPERSVAFTIAVIALGAKLAKADGKVTRDEVSAFRQVFTIPEGEEDNAARVFNLARQDVAGYPTYAGKIAAMFGAGDPVLIDLMEGLFQIALADGTYHENEDVFLRDVARIFGLGERCFQSLVSRFVPDGPANPYAILGVDPDAGLAAVRAAWRVAVMAAHPDRLAARGVPEEAVQLAERRLISINRAWAEISARHAA